MAKKSVSSHENLENFDSQMVLSLSQMVLHAAPPSGPRPSYSPESEKQPAEQPNGNLLQKKGPTVTSACGHDMMSSSRVHQRPTNIGSDVREAQLHFTQCVFWTLPGWLRAPSILGLGCANKVP